MRRDEIDIMKDILEISSNNYVRRTAIMYGANLNFSITKKYLENLEKDGLIEKDNNGKEYKTTKKGKEFLSKVREIKSLIIL